MARVQRARAGCGSVDEPGASSGDMPTRTPKAWRCLRQKGPLLDWVACNRHAGCRAVQCMRVGGAAGRVGAWHGAEGGRASAIAAARQNRHPSPMQRRPACFPCCSGSRGRPPTPAMATQRARGQPAAPGAEREERAAASSSAAQDEVAMNAGHAFAMRVQFALGTCILLSVAVLSAVSTLFLMEEGREFLLSVDSFARKGLADVAIMGAPSLAGVGHLFANVALTLPLFIVENWDIATLIGRVHKVQGDEALWLDGVRAVPRRCAMAPCQLLAGEAQVRQLHLHFHTPHGLSEASVTLPTPALPRHAPCTARTRPAFSSVGSAAKSAGPRSVPGRPPSQQGRHRTGWPAHAELREGTCRSAEADDAAVPRL